MPISEIPSKIIEKTQTLAETKLNIACELTRIVYTRLDTNPTEENVVKTFINCHYHIKDLIPPPLEKVPAKKKYFIIGAIVLSLVLGVGGYFMFKDKFVISYKTTIGSSPDQ